MRSIAVIGKNFGDEGKGYTCSRLASSLKKSLIIKHNGGGQAGHTVEDPKGKWRFIHHQIGAGAEYHVPTLFADSFMPDLFQLGKEVKDFMELFGFQPILYSEKNARITTIDDVLLNMGAELARGKNRHGSCGMGIEECVQRNAAGYGITVEELATWSKQELLDRLKNIRKEYTGRRAKILGIQEQASSKAMRQSNFRNPSNTLNSSNPSNSPIFSNFANLLNPYYEMLNNETVLENFVEEVKENVKLLTLVDADRKWLEEFQHLIFETGQGLLLDQDYEAYAPHLTSSKTGIHNPAIFLEKRGLSLDEAIYVTRPYVTRHGNGPLPCEVERSELPGVGEDLTNRPNEWQGTLRYAKHESLEDFFAPVIRDRDSLKQDECIEHIRKESTETTDVTGTIENIGGSKLPKFPQNPKLSILVTQLSETGNQLYFNEGNISFETLQKAGEELEISCVKDIEQL